MITIIVNKLYDLCRNARIYTLCLFSIFIFTILLIIRIFWKPIEIIMWFSMAIILLKYLYLKMPNNLSSKIGKIKYHVTKGNYDSALEYINKFPEKEINKLKGKKKDNIYYDYIFNKGTCLAHLTSKYNSLEYAKQAVECLEKALELSFGREKKFDIRFNTINLGTSYLCLGTLEYETRHIKRAIQLYETGLKYGGGKNLTTILHSQIALAYETLSKFSNKEENLKKALNQLITSYELLKEDIFSDNKAYICCSLGTVLRKLYEIEPKEDYRSEALVILNETINYYKLSKNKKSQNPKDYNHHFSNFQIGKLYFQMYKLEDSQDSLKNCIDQLKKARKYFTAEKYTKLNNEINDMLVDLIAF